MQNLYRIANIFGLNTDSLQHTVAITDAINLIADYNIDDFLEYARDKKGSIQFVTNTEKLDIVVRKFVSKQEEEQFEEIKKQIGDFIGGLLEKIRFLKPRIKTAWDVYCIDIDFADAIGVDENGVRTPFFTKKELKALESVGSTRYIIECLEDYTLSEKLQKIIFEKYIKEQKNKMIGNNTKALLPTVNRRNNE